MKRVLRIVVPIGLCGTLGCATLFASGNPTVRIESEPAQATVTAQNGMVLGTTPFVTQLKPQDYVLTFTKQGYSPASFALSKKVDGIAFLNLLCVLCWGIDFATGAVWGLAEDFVRVTLQPAEAGPVRPTAEMTQLACSNYAAVQHAVHTRSMTADHALAANAIIRGATAVSAPDCQPNK